MKRKLLKLSRVLGSKNIMLALLAHIWEYSVHKSIQDYV